MKSILPLIIFIFTDASFGREPIKIQTLFVFYDAGETFALSPVLDRLDQKKIDYRVLVMATARNFVKRTEKVIDVFDDCGISERIDGISWPKEKLLSRSDIDKIK